MRKIKEIKQETRISRVKDFIAQYKFLSDSKYYKTNKVSVAAYDSWAAQGQAGGCCLCPATNHHYGIHNKRYTTMGKEKGRGWSWQKIGGDLCSACYDEIEKQLNYKFNKW